MNAAPHDENLEALLDEFAMAFDHPPNHDELRAWLDAHPDSRDNDAYRNAVARFAARWSASDILGPRPGEFRADPARVARSRAVVARVIAELGHDAPITSLLAEARRVNRTLPEAAARAGLSVPLFALLDRRLVRFASLPDALFARLAEAIGRSVADVRAYLAGPPVLPRNAQFRADHAPVSAGATQDFFAAVRADPLLSEAEKAQWLALAPAENGHT
jgi:hypothetical protein